MARKNPSTAVATPKGGQALATLDQELQSEVNALRTQIGAPAGNRIKVKPTGVFIGPDGADYGTEIRVVVLDFSSKNFYYDGVYNEDNPQPPVCFAMTKPGEAIDGMAPVDESPEKQSDLCKVCPMNAFGSAPNGRKGKACKNTRELAVLLVDEAGSHNDPDAPIYTISLSPTNIKSFDGAVSNIARLLNGPPIKAILTLFGENVGTYASITCTDPVQNPDYGMHITRRAEAREILARLPDFTPRETPARSNARPAARRGGAAPSRTAGRGR